MPLRPEAQALCDRMQAGGPVRVSELPLDLLREGEAAWTAAAAGPAPEMASVEDLAVPGPAHDVPVRVYRPEAGTPMPVVVYFHGGGFVLCSVETHDPICRTLAHRARSVVVSVDYRLAPEHRFPAAVEDCIAATRWAHERARDLGADPSRLSVAGDSAGANLAAVVALAARDAGGPPIASQVLAYPVIDAACATPSFEEHADGYLLTADTMRWFWSQYLPDPAQGEDPRASPIRARTHAGLPPALVLTAEFDPLRDEGEAYAHALDAAGVPCTLRRFEGTIHGFLGFGQFLPEAGAAFDEIAAALARAWATPGA